MKSNNINQAWTQTQKYKYSKFNYSQSNRLWRHCHYTIPYNFNSQCKVSKTKDQLLFQELADNSMDIGLITETWLKIFRRMRYGSANHLHNKIYMELCFTTDLETIMDGDLL